MRPLALALLACTSPSPVADDARPGACPADTVRGEANGHDVCRAPSGVPRLERVFVIVMENTSWARVRDSAEMPYLHALLERGAHADDYHGVAHPSVPNYLALTAGDTQGVRCDCAPTGTACDLATCEGTGVSCACPLPATHLGDQIEAAGRTWKAYADAAGAPCRLDAGGTYLPRHVPFLYYDDVRQDAARCAAHVVDFPRLAEDLVSAAGAPSLSFIVPDVVHDMHSPAPSMPSTFANGDAWLAAVVSGIVTSPSFARALVVIVWDEDDFPTMPESDDPIPLIVLSPLVRGGLALAARADHYALLATIEDALGLPRLGHAADAAPLALFGS